MEFLVIAALLVLVVWIVSTRRRLCELSSNIDTALNQIGLQLSSRFRALTALRELAREYGLLVLPELQPPAVGAGSTPAEVLEQEQKLAEAMNSLSTAAGACPALKSDPAYARCVDAAECYSRMIYTSSLIYNDSVSRFNCTLRRVPARLIAGSLGFSPREYLEFAPDARTSPAPGPHTRAS